MIYDSKFYYLRPINIWSLLQWSFEMTKAFVCEGRAVKHNSGIHRIILLIPIQFFFFFLNVHVLKETIWKCYL